MKTNRLPVWLGLGAACLACCAPLLAPLAASVAGAGAFAGGRLFGLSIDAVVCGAIVVAITAGIIVWLVQRQRARDLKSCACETTCDVETRGPTARP